jgi:hypothetical protein
MQSGQDGNSGDPTEPLDRPWRFYLKPDAYASYCNTPYMQRIRLGLASWRQRRSLEALADS